MHTVYTTFARDRARRRAHIRPSTGIYIYTPTYWGLRFGGPPRLDLRLFNSSACQKHQCTLCSLIVLFPFLSFLPPACRLSFSCPVLLSVSLFLSLTLRSRAPSLFLFPVYPFSLSFVSVSLPPSRLSLSPSPESSLFPDFPSPFGARYPSFAAAPFGLKND